MPPLLCLIPKGDWPNPFTMVDFLYSCSLQCSTQSISHSIYSLCHGTPAGSQLLVFSTKAHEGHVCSTVSALKQQSLRTAHAGLCHGACVTDANWFFLWDHEQEEWGWITQGPCYNWVLGILLVSPTLLLLVLAVLGHPMQDILQKKSKLALFQELKFTV